METVFYCVGHIGYGNSKRYLTRLHQLALSFPEGKDIDHINHDGLDNRKTNLRETNDSLNQANARRIKRRGKTGYRGVRQKNANQGFSAQIVYGGKTHHLGTFASSFEAAMAYDKAAREIFGEHALTNHEDSCA
jgi:hypothetical protein